MTDAPKANNFDLLRITAAVAVLISHAFALTGVIEPRLLGGTSLGAAGVLVFFGISGFLVTESWRRDPHLWRFAARRGLRIFPALVVVLALTVLVVGPLATSLSPADYFSARHTQTYLPANLVMLKMQFTLPGVFAGNPFPLGVNGSLWSLRPELHAYVAVAVLGLAGVLASRRVASAVSVVLVVVLVGAPGVVASVIGEAGPLLAFLAGAMLLLWRDVVPWRWWILAILVAGWAVLPAGNLTAVWTAVTFAYGVLMLGYRTPGVGPRVLRGHDLSYGTYLYAFPVQQSVAALVPGISVAGMIAISLPVTLALGFASWHLIESPALRLKTRVVAGRERGAEALPAVA